MKKFLTLSLIFTALFLSGCSHQDANEFPEIEPNSSTEKQIEILKEQIKILNTAREKNQQKLRAIEKKISNTDQANSKETSNQKESAETSSQNSEDNQNLVTLIHDVITLREEFKSPDVVAFKKIGLWSDYVSEKTGFKIQHPNDWEVKEKYSSENPKRNDVFLSLEFVSKKKNNVMATINVFNGKQSINHWDARTDGTVRDGHILALIKKMLIDDASAEMVIYSATDIDQPRKIHIYKSDKTYQINLPKENRSCYSTFKFLDTE